MRETETLRVFKSRKRRYSWKIMKESYGGGIVDNKKI